MFDFTPPEVFRESKNLWFSNVIMWLVGRETKHWVKKLQQFKHFLTSLQKTFQRIFDVIALLLLNNKV